MASNSSHPIGSAPGSADPWRELVRSVTTRLSAVLAELGASVDAEQIRRELEDPPTLPVDLAFPAHRAAAAAGAAADAFARDLAARSPPIPGIVAVEANGAYVNFLADPVALARETLDLVFSWRDRYGHGSDDLGPVCVEHTSANPTGPFHIGRIRNALIGDTLARCLSAAGYRVTTQYYVDDVGRQAALITWIWSKPIEAWPPEVRATLGEPPKLTPDGEKPDRYWGRPYAAASAFAKQHPDAGAEVTELAARLEAGEAIPLHRELAQRILGGMLASLGRLGVGFDELVWESDLVRDGSVARVVERLRHAPHAVREENGAWALDTSSYGLPKERARVIVTRANGTSLYPTRDVAYHLRKFARFPRVLDVLGTDHLLHARTLSAMLAEIGEARTPEFVIYQYITSPDGGKMSTRAGTAVYLDDLLDEAVRRARDEVLSRREDLPDADVDRIAERVGAGAVRYHILRVAPEKTVRFRWEDALSFEGRAAPFVQYSYARAASILRKAERDRPPYPFRSEAFQAETERSLVRAISRLPGRVAYVARTAHVHALAGYAHELAETFNRFYQEVPVLRADGDARDSRLALVAATRQTLGNTLELLGVPRLETM
jgi:arginyl-tRNA synthetase